MGSTASGFGNWNSASESQHWMLWTNENYCDYRGMYTHHDIDCLWHAGQNTTLGILDAKEYTICPDCLTHVNCSTVGLANLEKHHRGKKVCQENKAKCAKEELQNQKQKRNGSLLNFFKKPKATHIPSTVSNPEPILSNILAPEKVTDTGGGPLWRRVEVQGS